MTAATVPLDGKLARMGEASTRNGGFVGRARELQVLDDALAAATEGEGSVVLVAGVAGIGKTRFCREVAARARRRGHTVAWGNCWPGGGAPPLWPWQEILGQLGDGTAVASLALDPGGSTVDPERFARFAAISEQLAAACSRSPVLVIIDDVHAADAGATLLTRFVARTLARRPLVLLLTQRIERDGANGAQPVSAVDDEATLVRLGCLGLAETEALLRTREQVTDDDLLRILFRLTGGHPLHLRHVTASGNAYGAVDRDAARAAIAWAVDQLSDKAQDLLSKAAILGPTPTVFEIATITFATLATVQKVLAEAVSAGLVTVEGRERFSFSHDLVREVLLDCLTVGDQVETHARAAGMLSNSTTGGVQRRARHAHHALLAASRSTTDARRAVGACRAAAYAMTDGFGYEAAAELLASAAGVHEQAGVPDPVAPLLVEWAEAVLRCGRLTEARELFDRAAAAAMAEGDAVALARASLGLGGMWINEHRTRLEYERVTGLQRRALAGLPADEHRLRHRVEVRLAAEDVYQGGPVEPALAALDRARLLGDGPVLAEALSLVHHALLTPGQARARLALADELIAVASRAGEGLLALLGLCWRVVDLFHLGDGRAERTLAELRQRTDVIGCLSIRYIVEAIDTMLLIRAGRMEEAETSANACFTLGTQVGDADALGFLGAHLTTIRWLQGRDAEMLDMVEQIAASPTLNPAEFAFEATIASLAARAGQAEKAQSVLDRLTAVGLANLPESSTWLGGMLAIVEAARALGDAGLARQAYELLTPYAELPIMPSLAIACFGSVERVLGVAAVTFGDLVLAVEHLERSVHANRLLGNRPVTAVANADLAEALLRRQQPGDRERARTLLGEAFAEAEAMGLTGRASMWRGRLDGLTGQEATICRQYRQWTLTFGDRQALVADRIGVRYLTRLLTNPGRPIPALELAGDSGAAALGAAARQPMLDDHARTAYRNRIHQLTHELAKADVRGDQVGSQRLQSELDTLLHEVGRITGKGGRTRTFADPGERARTAVRKAIKRALDDVTATEPALGALLAATVTTGNVCSYNADPAAPLRWTYIDGRSAVDGT
jgi:hypothetical protein